ncbi:RNA repair transcriptional activator RtcR [Moraxella sp. VT-16-12]|uniref:RNA repair transcriptional activator RtcR n=1 Tax=Moraxella sp. VT-16-12 TaxID=2014877 RepID=UPI000B7FD71F|nr:RNA repair transcriptional activator RtcR [Moraxella sp. VT-16-12]TWV84661.1 AAA family ATPase [Moraxella sp. VT-16-12]
MKKTVMIGFLGTVLDDGFSQKRHKKWRPNVNVHHVLDIDRVELFIAPQYERLALQVADDIYSIRPDMHINFVNMPLDNPWDFGEVYEKLASWADSYEFDIEKENYLTHITTGTHVAQICLFLLVESRQIPSVLLQTAPPKGDDALCKTELIDLDLARYDVLASRLDTVKNDAMKFLKTGIETKNAAFNRLIGQIEQVAMGSNSPMLIMGATGAGKSRLAKRIYELKKARHLVSGRFVDVNCATLRGDMAYSALFGHKKGAFTGAMTARDGYLLTAHKGVLFLDEIGELGADEQAMLLTALEDKSFYPMGSDTPVHSDFWLIAGTNKDLKACVKAGTFREDLYARINIWQYVLPALAHRREDIAPNINYQLAVANQELGRTVRFDKAAYERYLVFAMSEQAVWTGNFRDLSASLLRLATLATGGRIDEGLVDDEIRRLLDLWVDDEPLCHQQAVLLSHQLQQKIEHLHIDEFDKMQLINVIKFCQAHDSLASAGRALFDVSRKGKTTSNDSDRLRKYLGKFGITWQDICRL